MGNSKSSQPPPMVQEVRKRARRVVEKAPPETPLVNMMDEMANDNLFEMALTNLSIKDAVALGQTSKARHDVLLTGAYFRALAHRHFRSPFPPHRLHRLLENLDVIFGRYTWTGKDHPGRFILPSKSLTVLLASEEPPTNEEMVAQYWRNAYAACNAYVRYALYCIAGLAVHHLVIERDPIVRVITALNPGLANRRLPGSPRDGYWRRWDRTTIMDNNWVATRIPSSWAPVDLCRFGLANYGVPVGADVVTAPVDMNALDHITMGNDHPSLIYLPDRSRRLVTTDHVVFAFENDPAKTPALRIDRIDVDAMEGIIPGITSLLCSVKTSAIDIDVMLDGLGETAFHMLAVRNDPKPVDLDFKSDLAELLVNADEVGLPYYIGHPVLVYLARATDIRQRSKRSTDGYAAEFARLHAYFGRGDHYVIFREALAIAAAEPTCGRCNAAPATHAMIRGDQDTRMVCAGCAKDFS